MAITLAQQGLSATVMGGPTIGGTTAFDSLQQQTRNITAVGSNPAAVVDLKLAGNNLSSLQYPQDLGKYQFIIIESQFQNRNGGRFGINSYIKWSQVIKLPLPVPLTEQYTVNYDHDFNLASALADAIPGGGQLGKALGNLSTAALQASGLSVNSYKAITLKNPSFNTHEFNWKFSPKNYQESVAVQSIIYNLKRGMLPTLEANRTLFGFPSVYQLFFVPNVQFLYKFKPCVLQNMAVDYLGGNPSPAFFGGGGSKGSFTDFSLPNPTNPTEGAANLLGETQTITYNSSDNPPESVVIKTRWLELEYWVKSDFDGGMNSTNPFDVNNWFNNRGFTNPFIADAENLINNTVQQAMNIVGN